MKDDTISRQAVLKLLSTMPPEEAITKAMLIQNVKYMSAAQPDGPDNLVKDSQGLAKDLVNDCISRKAAIDAFDGVKVDEENCTEYDIGYNDGIDFAVSRLSVLPSAQPERKRGEWEFYEDRSPVWDIAGEKTWARVYKCSECGFVHAVIEDFGIYQYCPQCGADMREDNHETD